VSLRFFVFRFVALSYINDHSPRDFVTGQLTADAMAQLIRVFCNVGAGADGSFILCDAFACVGGNTLAFARLNFYVFALEVPNSKNKSLKPQPNNTNSNRHNSVDLMPPLRPHPHSSLKQGPRCCFTTPQFVMKPSYLFFALVQRRPLNSCAVPLT
jgi:hypothetical protein